MPRLRSTLPDSKPRAVLQGAAMGHRARGSGALPFGGLALGVAVLVSATFWPGLSARALTLDDGAYLTENALVQNPSWAAVGRFLSEVRNPSTVGGYYHPLTMISLMLDCAAGGGADDLRVFHRTNLMLHVASTLLVMGLIYVLFGSPRIAALVALLFGLHPMNAECVAWVADRKTVLSGFFVFAMLLCYVRYARAGGRGKYVATLILYVLAFLSKPTAAIVPVLLVVLDWWPLRRVSWRAMLEKLPLFTLGALFAAITLVSEGRGTGQFFHTQSAALAWPLVFAHNLTFYLKRIVWPAGLSVWYPFPPRVGPTEPSFLVGVVTTLLLAVVGVWSLRWTRGLAAGLVFFAVGFLPTVGAVVRVADMISADRFIYFPAFGLLLVLAAALIWVWQRPLGRRRLVRVGTVGIVVALGTAEALVARRELDYWTDSIRLHEHMIALAPEASKPHANLGFILLGQGRAREAAGELREALRLAPDNAQARCNLAAVLADEGYSEQAIAEYTRALRQRPDLAAAHNNLGLLLEAQGRDSEAVEQYTRALSAKPDLAAAHNNLALVLAKRGEIDGAIEHLRTSVRLKARDPETHRNLADMLKERGQMREAVQQYGEALRQQPDWILVLNNLAWILATASDPQVRDAARAVELARHACELTRPEQAAVLDTLAAAYAAAGHFSEAVETAKQASAIAENAGQLSRAREIEARLRLYEVGQPCSAPVATRPAPGP